MKLGHELWEEDHRDEVAFLARDSTSGRTLSAWPIAVGVGFHHLAEVCLSGSATVNSLFPCPPVSHRPRLLGGGYRQIIWKA